MTNDLFTVRALATGKYRRQPWYCETCDALGEVLIHKTDTTADEHWRIHQSHRAQRSSRRCPTPVLRRGIK